MRFLPIVVTLVLSAAAAAQSLPWPLTHSTAFRHTALDLASDGKYVWIATGWGVVRQLVVDGEIRSGTSLAVPGRTSEVEADGGLAWVGSGHVLYTIREGNGTLGVRSTLALPGTVNDLLRVGDFLYAGTSSGLVQVDLLVPEQPVIARSLPTSAGGVTSLAADSGRLYAVDADVSVDVYNISIPSVPQRVGEIMAFPRNTSVSVAGNHIIVSDGRQSRLFSATSDAQFVGTLPSPVDAAAGLAGSVVASASSREIRVWDLANPASPALLWSMAAPVTAGTVNNISSLAVVDGTIIAAAGDAGAPAWRLLDVTAPHQTAAWRSASLSSVAVSGDWVVTSLSSGGIQSWRLVATGLEPRDVVEEGVPHILADSHSGRFLTISGSSLVLWNHASYPPQRVAVVPMAAGVRAAVLREMKAWVILTNGTGVTVDFSVSPALVQAWDHGVESAYMLAAAGDRIAVTGLSGDHSLVRVHTASGQMSEPSTIAGSASAGFAVDADGRVAALTFAGLHLIDPGSAPRVINGVLPVDDLVISDGELVLLRGDRAEVRRWNDGAVIRIIDLPGSFSSASAIPGTRRIAAGGDSMIALITNDDAAVPENVAGAWTNGFGRDLFADDEWVYIRDAQRLTRYSVTQGGSLVPTAWITVPSGLVDLVVVDGHPVTLDSSGEIALLDWNGGKRGSVSLPAAPDFVALNLEVVRGAVYAAYRRGCTAGGCEERTEVLDPSSMTLTASLNGGVTAAAWAGNSAWVLTQLPREVHRLDISDPLHPVVIASRETGADFVSIARDAARDRVWILGRQLVRISPTTLVPEATYLTDWTADPSGEVSFNDQRVRSSNGTLLVTGRDDVAMLWVGGDPAVAPVVWRTPSGVRRAEPLRDGFVLVTAHSIEVAMSREIVRRRGVSR